MPQPWRHAFHGGGGGGAPGPGGGDPNKLMRGKERSQDGGKADWQGGGKRNRRWVLHERERGHSAAIPIMKVSSGNVEALWYVNHFSEEFGGR